MFRVDVYAHEGEGKPKLLPPAYASLATSPADSGGRLLTVGRKNSTFVLDKDKSVSRDHFHLHLMSNNQNHQTVAGVPSSSEEKQACAESPTGMALLVKNFGKFGTVVVAMAPFTDAVDNTERRQETTGNDSDTDTGGSDTEDESQTKDKPKNDGFSLPAIADTEWQDKTQEIATKLFRDKKHRVVVSAKLGAKESLAIPGSATSIMVQVGQSGSLLVLTRIDLKFAKSSWPQNKKEQQKFKDNLYKLGAQLVEENVEDFLLEAYKQKQSERAVLDSPLPPSTLLVASKKEPGSKQLVAWSLGFPFANLAFLQSLLDRGEPQDPFPNYKDYDPPAPEGQEFWSKEASPHLWQSCTFLSTNKTQSEKCKHIVQAAGASVCLLDDMDEKEAKKKVSSLLADPDIKSGLFCISGGKKRLTKFIKDQGIPQLHEKKLTMSFCEQMPLRDEENDRVLGKLVASETEISPDEEVPNQTPPASPDSDVTVEEQVKPEKEIADTKSSKRKLDTTTDQGINDKVRTNDADDAHRPSQRKRSRKTSSQEPSISQSQRYVEVLPSVQEESEILHDSGTSEEADFSPQQSSQKRKDVSPLDDSELSGTRKRAKATESPSRRPAAPGTSRLVTVDGWLVVAPKNSADREGYRRPESEVLDRLEKEDGELFAVAETVVCSSLILRPYDPNRSSAKISGIGMKSRSGKDFKRFKKNKVIKGKARIELKAAQAKESLMLRELEEQQKAIDAQQRMADELFADQGKKQSKIKATRRHRNG